MGGKKDQKNRRQKWTVPPFKRDPHRELRAAAQLGGLHVGGRQSSYDIDLRGKRVEVKCPDESGVIAIASDGRKAISKTLGDLYHDLTLLSCNCGLSSVELALADEYMSTFVNGVTIKLARELKRLFDAYDYFPSVDLEQLVKPSVVFANVDLLMLTWRNGWELVPKRDFDRRLRYYRYAGGLVKLALNEGR